MANLSNINNKLIVTDGGNLLVNATANLATYGGITIDNFSDPSIAMKTTGTSGWLWTQYITSTGTNNFSMGVNQTAPYWCVKAGAGMDSPHLVVDAAGEVGIGTTAPSEKLEVNSGSIFVNGENNGIIVDSVSKRVGLMKYSGHEAVIARASTNDFGIVRCHTSDIFDGSSLTYDFYVSGTGNVGIGTDSPNQEGFGAANIALSVKAPTSGGVANLELIGLGNNEGDEVGYVNFMSQAATNSLAAIVGIRRSDDTTGKLQFRTTGTTKFTIEDDNQIRFAGDFYLVTNTSNTADTGSLNISGGGGFGDSRGASIGLAGNENGNGGLMQLRAGDGSVGGIRYYTGGSERMRLAGRLISFNSTTGVQEIRGDAASAKFAIGNMGDASSQMMVSSRGFLTLNVSNTGSALDATERMRITSGGNSFFNYSNGAIETYGSGVYGGKVVIKASGAEGLSLLNNSIGGSSQVAFNFTNEFVANQYNFIARIIAEPEQSWTSDAATRDARLSFFTSQNGSAGERMRITSSGTIFMYGLGGYTSSNADVRYATSSSELYYQTSSKRYKTNIVNLENSLDKINKLRPVRYVDINTEEPACGLIAEETVELIPEVVFTKEIEGFDEPQVEGINYSDIVPFLIKAIQELKAEIELLKSK